jgi:hypothetical protein
MKKYTKNVLSILFVAILLFVHSGLSLIAEAASVSSFKDTMSTQAPSTTATHTLTWTLVGGDTVAAGDTFTVDFVDADFTLNAIGNWQTSDFSFNDGTARTITAVSSSSGVDPTCTAGTNNVAVTINTSTNNFKVTACSTYSASSANANITFTINGTTASGTGTMTNKSSDVDSSLVSLSQSNADTGSAAVAVETNGVVSITATVAPTLTFSNDDNAIGFGTLSAGSATYANGAGTGSGTAVTANTFAIGTNASGGYILTYNGANLTSGINTIPTANGTTTISADADGSPGTAQWGMGATITGTGTVASGYEAASNNWKFVPSATTTLASSTGPASDSIAMRYLANIASTTPAGSYTTSITYVATGTF